MPPKPTVSFLNRPVPDWLTRFLTPILVGTAVGIFAGAFVYPHLMTTFDPIRTTFDPMTDAAIRAKDQAYFGRRGVPVGAWMGAFAGAIYGAVRVWQQRVLRMDGVGRVVAELTFLPPTKPDEKKPDDKKPDEKKPEDKKPEGDEKKKPDNDVKPDAK